LVVDRPLDADVERELTLLLVDESPVESEPTLLALVLMPDEAEVESDPTLLLVDESPVETDPT
jgi:hypothetical protein